MSQLGVQEWRFWDSGSGLFPCSIARALSLLCFWISSCGSLRAPCSLVSSATFPQRPYSHSQPQHRLSPWPLFSPWFCCRLFWADCPWGLPAKQTPQASSWIISGHWCWFLLVQWCQALPVFFLCGLSPCSLIQWCLSLLTLDITIGFLPRVTSTLQGALRAVTGSFLGPQEFPPSRGRNSLSSSGSHFAETLHCDLSYWASLPSMIHSFIELHKPLPRQHCVPWRGWKHHAPAAKSLVAPLCATP